MPEVVAEEKKLLVDMLEEVVVVDAALDGTTVDVDALGAVDADEDDGAPPGGWWRRRNRTPLPVRKAEIYAAAGG